ncbi:MAG TPA: hypothetical protein VHK67_07600 [Rhabdochlamydiaceae bacterium]|jgi:hypothetical protein|nr:hypothetical protein [Rhabdochlamydiaceae bacterium]
MVKFLFRLILLVLVFLFLLFLFAPNMLSTKKGKELFFKAYKSMTGNTLTADTFEISWWQEQKIENLSAAFPKNKMSFAGPKVVTDATLWQILFYKNLGNLEIISPQITFNADLPIPAKKKISQAGFVPEITHNRLENVNFGSVKAPGLHASGNSHFQTGRGIAAVPMQAMPSYLGHITVKSGTIRFIGKGFDPIELQAVSLDTSLSKSLMKIKGNGKTSQGGDFDIAVSYQPSQIDLAANLKNFPTRSIDQTVSIFEPKLKGVILGSIGEALNVELKLKNLPETLELFCDANSPSFSAHIETASKDGKITLATPALIQFQIPELLIPELKNPFKGQLKIDTLSLPLNDRENCAFQATLKGQALQFPFGTIQPFALFLSTDSFKTRQFTLKLDSPDAQLNSSLYLPNDWTQMNWSGEGLFAHNTQVKFSAQTLSAVTATIQGDKWKGSFSGGFDPTQNVVFLNKPAEISYQLAELPPPLPPVLDQPTKLQIQIQPCKVALATMSGPISLQIQADPTTIKGLQLGQTIITASGELKNQKGIFQLSSSIGSGTINATGSFGWPKDIAAKVNLVQFPTSFLDLFLSTEVAPIVGQSLNATIDMSQAAQKKQLSFDVKSDTLSAQASLEQTAASVKLIKPAKVALTLLPEGYAALDRQTPFKLNQPAVIAASINSMSLPFAEEKPVFSDLLCQTDLTIGNLNFSGKNSDQSIELSNVLLRLDHATKANPLRITLSAGSSLFIQGNLNPSTGSLDLRAKLDQFPTAALDVISRALTGSASSVSMTAILGPQVNLTASSTLTHWNGPVKFQLNSTNISASLDGAISNGLLHLNNDFQLQLLLTPALSRVLLNSVNPLDLSAITAEAPITLKIPAQGFSYPVHPSNPALINIPSGRLDLGKLYCHNEGNVNVTLGLLKLQQFSQNQNLELWFAPLDLHVVNGIMECERTEILLAQTYQVCVWGDLKFPSKKVDMVLGLTAGCLRAAFGIKDLPNDYVLQIPMKGPMNDVKINTGKATAKIAALLLWQQKDVALGKSSLGKLLNKVGPLPDSDTKAPPAKRPFPWEQH